MAAIVIEVNKIPTDLLEYFEPLQQSKGSLWTIPTQACKEAHFATYPEKLVQPMIEAGCPMYVCDKCGKPRKKIYETTIKINRTDTYNGKQLDQEKQFSHKRIQMLVKAGREAGLDHNNTVPPKLFKGYSDCGCNASFSPGIVLDPFCGSATTCYVAAKLKRDYIGIELNPKYIQDIASFRMQEAETSITVQEQRQGQKALFE